MYPNQELMQYFQQMSDFLLAQSKKLEYMQHQLDQLHQGMSEWKEKQVPNVIKNEYHFDLLKVEKLEGTLNIGLNPKGNDSPISDMSIGSGQEGQAQEESGQPLFERVQKAVYRFLDKDAYKLLQRIEEECGYPLDPAYRKFILEDIKKQIDPRIRYYLGQLDTDELEPEQIDAWVEKVVQKVKRDIENTCVSFIQHLPRQMEGDSSHAL